MGAKEITTNRSQTIIFLLMISMVSLLLPYVPFGQKLGYPFQLLMTWFHEMGHGLTMIFVGSTFSYLEIFSNGSGLAHSSSTPQAVWMNLSLSKALVSLGGLIGPPIVGSLCLIMSKNPKDTHIILIVFSIFSILSAIIWVKIGVGFFIIIPFGMVAAWIAWKGHPTLKQLTVQFIGIQATLSTFNNIDYLFTDYVSINGSNYPSDVSNISTSIGLPYWFWGIMVAALSFYMIFLAFKSIFTPQKV
ncbi:MAG: M50 family metallopeptidase [Mariprofundaceae bacterium]|nr:M50 family metallopeptidase [Mariprofundaceae bacterium]